MQVKAKREKKELAQLLVENIDGERPVEDIEQEVQTLQNKTQRAKQVTLESIGLTDVSKTRVEFTRFKICKTFVVKTDIHLNVNLFYDLFLFI